MTAFLFALAEFSLKRVEDLPDSFGTYVQYVLSACIDPQFIIDVKNEDGIFFFFVA